MMPKTKLVGSKPPKKTARAAESQPVIPVPILEVADTASAVAAAKPTNPAKAQPAGKSAQQAAPPTPVMLKSETIEALMTVALVTLGEALGAEPTKLEIDLVSTGATLCAQKYGTNWKYAPEAMLLIGLSMAVGGMWIRGRANKVAALEAQKRTDAERQAA